MTSTGRKLRRSLLGSLAGLCVLVLLYAAVIRPRALTLHATDEESARTVIGDDLVPAPISVLTHAITIRRPPHEVWPWLVQMGAGRAGWYSYDFIDNGRQPSLEHIAPELQQIEVGTIMPALRGMTEGFTVLRIEPERALVLGWLSPAGPPVTTWAFVLEEPEPGSTRLLVRNRASSEYHPPFGLPDVAIRTLVPSASPRCRQGSGAEAVDSDWRTLYRVAGAAALLTALLIPIQILVFVVWPPPLEGTASDCGTRRRQRTRSAPCSWRQGRRCSRPGRARLFT